MRVSPFDPSVAFVPVSELTSGDVLLTPQNTYDDTVLEVWEDSDGYWLETEHTSGYVSGKGEYRIVNTEH
jgi:hypothetical protein